MLSIAINGGQETWVLEPASSLYPLDSVFLSIKWIYISCGTQRVVGRIKCLFRSGEMGRYMTVF